MMSVLPLLAVLVQTLNGASIDALRPPAGAKAIVYLFVTTDCPISNRYAPEVQRLSGRFASEGVVFRLVYPGRHQQPAAIRDHIAAFHPPAANTPDSTRSAIEAFRDPDAALAAFTGATITPEAAVIVNGKVVYRGRIDDRFADLGVERAAPTTHDLADAIAAVVQGRPIAHPVTQAVGCYIADLTR